MFTGIVEAVGRIESAGARLNISGFYGDFQLGESLCVNGVCLTLVAMDHGLAFDLSEETLARTTLGTLLAGDAVNLERAMCLGDRLGGHFVQGHVDGIAQIKTIEHFEASIMLLICVPEPRFLADKGSITLDGVSLTVVNPKDNEFEVHLVPHTLQNTNFSDRKPGDQLNVEYDILAKHVERLLLSSKPKET